MFFKLGIVLLVWLSCGNVKAQSDPNSNTDTEDNDAVEDALAQVTNYPSN